MSEPTTPEAIRERLGQVRDRVAAAARRAGRDPSSITLIAVSKTRPPEDVRAAYAAGHRDFGENYAQELRDKARVLADLDQLRLHAIGSLQVNKVKYVAQVAHAFHALDDLSIARALDTRCRALARVLPCYIEVSLAPEPGKGGVESEEAVEALLQACAPLSGIEVVGLMCIPPPSPTATSSRPWFRRLNAMAARLRIRHPRLTRLSMGMSQDFEVAIEEGATEVRVGTAIFGAR